MLRLHLLEGVVVAWGICNLCRLHLASSVGLRNVCVMGGDGDSYFGDVVERTLMSTRTMPPPMLMLCTIIIVFVSS